VRRGLYVNQALGQTNLPTDVHSYASALFV